MSAFLKVHSYRVAHACAHDSLQFFCRAVTASVLTKFVKQTICLFEFFHVPATGELSIHLRRRNKSIRVLVRIARAPRHRSIERYSVFAAFHHRLTWLSPLCIPAEYCFVHHPKIIGSHCPRPAPASYNPGTFIAISSNILIYIEL